MRYEELERQLVGHGWEPCTGSAEHASFRKGCLVANCRFSISGGAYGLLCYVVDDYGKKEVVATMSFGDAKIYECYYGDIWTIIDILCGEYENIVKKFKELYLESILDKVLV